MGVESRPPARRPVFRRIAAVLLLPSVGALALASASRAGAASARGRIALRGAVVASLPIVGGCTTRSNAAATIVTLRTQSVNGAVLSIAGNGAAPRGAVNLAHSTSFNVELQIASGPGAGGIWFAGYGAGHDLGSGSLSMSRNASTGTIGATLEPYGGSRLSKPVQVAVSWNCAAHSSTPPSGSTTTVAHRSQSPGATLQAMVPSSLFGCALNTARNLGGANVAFAYNATAEVDCPVDGVTGVATVIYLLYPSTSSMNAAFNHVFVGEAARPKSGLGCTRTFASDVCTYHIGNATTPAGQYVRFFYHYSSDPYALPSIAWTSNRFHVITFISGTAANSTSAVANYWVSGKPNPV